MGIRMKKSINDASLITIELLRINDEEEEKEEKEEEEEEEKDDWEEEVSYCCDIL